MVKRVKVSERSRPTNADWAMLIIHTIGDFWSADIRLCLLVVLVVVCFFFPLSRRSQSSLSTMAEKNKNDRKKVNLFGFTGPVTDGYGENEKRNHNLRQAAA